MFCSLSSIWRVWRPRGRVKRDCSGHRRVSSPATLVASPNLPFTPRNVWSDAEYFAALYVSVTYPCRTTLCSTCRYVRIDGLEQSLPYTETVRDALRIIMYGSRSLWHASRAQFCNAFSHDRAGEFQSSLDDVIVVMRAKRCKGHSSDWFLTNLRLATQHVVHRVQDCCTSHCSTQICFRSSPGEISVAANEPQPEIC